MKHRIGRLLITGAVIALGSASLAAVSAKRTEPAAARPASQRPDIVLIVLDDVGFSDIGAFGSEIRTPAIDALAQGGLRYNRFDTKAICSPTRASLMTGRNSQTVRMEDLASTRATPDDRDEGMSKGELPSNAQAVAQALRGAGYDTWAIGKWHLAPSYDKAKASWPLQRGFDHFYGFIGGWSDQYRPELVDGNASVPVPATAGYHLSIDLVDHAIAALSAPPGTDRQPRFVYLALGAAHAPIQVPKRYIDPYVATYAKGWDAIRAERFARLKAMGVIPRGTILPPRDSGDPSWASLSDQQRQVYTRFMATYAGFLTQADEQIGRLVARLKRSGRFDNTLIVLLSDNGAAPEGGQAGGFRRPYFDQTPLADIARDLDQLGGPTTQPLYQRPWAMASDTPFRRYKLWPYAGGIRTPLIVSWPARIRAKGVVRTQLIDAVDIAPTLLDAAGTRFSPRIAGKAQIPVAGRSILRSFASPSAGGRQVQYFELRGNRAITSGRWKAVAMHRSGTPFDQDRWELFDTSRDFAEAHDVAALYPRQLEAMKALWWREARTYSKPPVAEPTKLIQSFRLFDDAFREDR